MQYHVSFVDPTLRKQMIKTIFNFPAWPKNFDLLLLYEDVDAEVVIPYPHEKWGERYMELESIYADQRYSFAFSEGHFFVPGPLLPRKELRITREKITFGFDLSPRSGQYPLPLEEEQPNPDTYESVRPESLCHLNNLYHEAVSLTKKLLVFTSQDLHRRLSSPVGFFVIEVFIEKMIKQHIIHKNEQLDRYVVTW